MENTLKGLSGLHGLVGCHLQGGLVNPITGIVHNGVRTAFLLRNDSYWCKFEVRHVMNCRVEEYNPLSHLDHVIHVFLEERCVLPGS